MSAFEDANEQTQRAFYRWAGETTRRRVQITAIVLSVTLVISIAVELLFASETIQAVNGVAWLVLHLAICVLCSLLMKWLPFSRRFPAVAAAVFASVLAIAVALYLSSFGGFDGPFFYSVYVLAPVVAFLPCALTPRIIITTMMVGGFVFAYLIPHPEYLEYPLLRIPATYVLLGGSVSILLGHFGYNLTREHYVLNELLSSDNQKLTTRVDASAKKVSDLVHRLEVSKTAERTNIARYLHDELGQLIVGARINVTNLERNFKTWDVDAPREELLVELENLSGIVEGLHYSSRVLCDELRDGKLPSLDLRIRALIEALPKNSAIEVRFSCDSLSSSLPLQTNEAVYRITQEALSNALKYAGSCCVDISIREQQDRKRRYLVVRIDDNGGGFDVNTVKPATWGLVGMRERVETLLGQLTISSGPEGTQICAHIPLNETEDES